MKRKTPTCAELSWTHSAFGASGSVKFMLCDCNAIDSSFFFYFLLSIKFIACENYNSFFSFFFSSIGWTNTYRHFTSLRWWWKKTKKNQIKQNRTKLKIIIWYFKLRIPRKSLDFLSFVNRFLVHSSEHDPVCS